MAPCDCRLGRGCCAAAVAGEPQDAVADNREPAYGEGVAEDGEDVGSHFVVAAAAVAAAVGRRKTEGDSD